jgi:transposase
MIRHTEQFKLLVVERYLVGLEGYRRVGAHFGLAPAMVRRWVSRYQLYGTAGLAKRVGSFSAEFKLSVLQHMWDNSLSKTRVALLFDVRNTASISIWETRYLSGGIDALGRISRREPDKMDAPTSKPTPAPDDQTRTHEDLLKELEYLRMENAVLKKFQALADAKKKQTTPKKR